MDDHIYPRTGASRAARHAESVATAPIVEQLKIRARDAGLWNLFLPGEHGAGLTNLQYAPLAEIMGPARTSLLKQRIVQPDTGK